MQNVSLNRPFRKIPDRLIYKYRSKGTSYHDGKKEWWRMFDINTGKLLGEMDTKHSFNFHTRNCDYRPELYISYLKANEKSMGVGSDFINFARTLSMQAEMEGRLAVHAQKLKGEDTYPHLFYRKQGFKTESWVKNLLMDLCILLGLGKYKFKFFDKPTFFYNF